MPPAGHVRGEIALSIGAELRQFVRENRLGKTYAAETGFKVAANPDHVLAADAAYIRQERANNVGESTGFWPGAPDLAVEVISPRDAYSDVAEKALDWLDAGTRMVLVIDPRCARRLRSTARRPTSSCYRKTTLSTEPMWCPAGSCPFGKSSLPSRFPTSLRVPRPMLALTCYTVRKHLY